MPTPGSNTVLQKLKSSGLEFAGVWIRMSNDNKGDLFPDYSCIGQVLDYETLISW